MPLVKQFFLAHSPIILVVLIVALLTAIGESAKEILGFNHKAIINGQWHRIITGHLVHLSSIHALFNMIAAVIGWLLLKNALTIKQWFLTLLINAMIISLFLLLSNVAWYVGFSALIHALIPIAVGNDRKLSQPIKLLVIGGLIIKVIYEQIYGAALTNSQLIGGAVLVQSHLFGLISGIATLLFLKRASLKAMVNRTL